MKFKNGRLPSGTPAHIATTPDGIRVAIVKTRKGASIFARAASGLWEKVGQRKNVETAKAALVEAVAAENGKAA